MYITENEIYEVGRTAVQITCRENDGCTGLPVNEALIEISSNVIADTGLQPADYHAGSSITITDRNEGDINVFANDIQIGLDTYTPGLRAAILAKPDYPLGVPYGSGAMVFWNASPGTQVLGNLAVTHNRIEYEDSSGDRQAICVSDANHARVYRNTVHMGARTQAIELGCTGVAPTAYCVANNVLFPGNGGSADVYLLGSVVQQPLSLGVPSCP